MDESVEDFTIRAHPKDTLVMAGGTKFGDDTNKLLKELSGNQAIMSDFVIILLFTLTSM